MAKAYGGGSQPCLLQFLNRVPVVHETEFSPHQDDGGVGTVRSPPPPSPAPGHPAHGKPEPRSSCHPKLGKAAEKKELY